MSCYSWNYEVGSTKSTHSTLAKSSELIDWKFVVQHLAFRGLKAHELPRKTDKLVKKTTSYIYEGVENKNHSSDQRKMLTSDRRI